MNSRNLLTAGILTLGLSSGAHAVLIDDFDGASGTVGAECTFGPTDETNGAPIGGTRTLSCSNETGFVTFGTIDSPAPTIDEVLSYAAVPGSKADPSVIWDAAGTGLGGLDLTLNNAEQFVFSVAFLDGPGGTYPPGNFAFTLEVVDTSLNTWSFAGDSGPNPLIDMDFVIPFSAGTGELSALKDADKISLLMTSNYLGVDFAIDSLSTEIPIPAPLALMGLGLLGIAGVRRRLA